jgi:hypothetical protein
MRNMATKRNLEEISKTCRDILAKDGEDGLFLFLKKNSLIRLQDNPDLEKEFIETSEDFFSLYRTTGEEHYFTLGKILRRVGHAVYRHGFMINPKKTMNTKKFLNLLVK